jgi:hypothetical protein
MRKIINKDSTTLIIISLLCFYSSQSKSVEILESKGYKVFPMNSLSIVRQEGRIITPLTREENNCDILLSGTFYGSQLYPVGPFLINNKLQIDYPKTLSRGFVAIMSDGSIKLSSMSDTDFDYRNREHRKEMYKRFNSHLSKIENTEQKRVVQLMGGGAHLIMPDESGEGYALSKEALEGKQFFDQGIGDLNSAQMRSTNHIVIITIRDQTFALITPKVSGKKLQKDLLESQVRSAIKFDGGSGCSAFKIGSNINICPSNGANPSGFCINF